MSQKLLEAVWKSSLPQPMKTVLTIYAWYGRDEGTGIFPSIETVASRTSYSKRSVHSITKKAVDMGILVQVKRRGSSHGYVTEYRMDISRMPSNGETAEVSAPTDSDFRPATAHSSADSSTQSRSEVRTSPPDSAHSSAGDQYEYKKSAERERQGGLGAPNTNSPGANEEGENLNTQLLDRAARRIIDMLGLPQSNQLFVAVKESVRSKAKGAGISIEAAHDFIALRAWVAKRWYPPKTWAFWFGDAGDDDKEREFYVKAYSERYPTERPSEWRGEN